jgi:hypothetical protein
LRARDRQLIACELQGIGDWKNGASIEASADQGHFSSERGLTGPTSWLMISASASIGVARVRLARRPGP